MGANAGTEGVRGDKYSSTVPYNELLGVGGTRAPRFDEDGEWDANGWERVPTWQRKPRS